MENKVRTISKTYNVEWSILMMLKMKIKHDTIQIDCRFQIIHTEYKIIEDYPSGKINALLNLKKLSNINNIYLYVKNL